MFKIFNNSGEEKGAILILFAFLALPLIILAALVIDTSRITITQSEMDRIASSMALGSLEDFLRIDGDFDAKKSAAIARAETIARLETNTPLGTPTVTVVKSGQGLDEVATMTIGQWWFEEPAETCNAGADSGCACVGGTTCPCNGSDFVGPCLEETSDVDDINAISLTVRSQPSVADKIASAFGSIVDLSNLEIEVKSTASVVPRNGVFLIDMSRSTVFDTHLPVDRLNDPSLASEYAFRLADGFTCTDGVAALSTSCTVGSVENFCLARFGIDNLTAATLGTRIAECGVCFSGGSCTGAETTQCENDFDSSLGIAPNIAHELISGCNGQCPPIQPGSANEVWHNQMADSGAYPASAPHTTHYRNDYECRQIAVPDAPGASAHDEYYFVEIQANTGGPDNPPEPLATILTGVNSALQEISDRSISGDSVTFIAFDDVIFPIGSPIRTFGPTKKGETEFDNLLALTNSGMSQDSRISSFLFPGSGAGRGETNISGALLAAKDVLTSRDNFSVAENFVVLFSDGLATCYHRGGGCMFDSAGNLGATQCLSPSIQNVANIGFGELDGSGFYRNGYAAHLMSLKEATQVISRRDGFSFTFDGDRRHSLPTADQGVCANRPHQDSLHDLGIRFHYFAIGDAVRPFTVLKSNNFGGCTTEEERLDEDSDTANLGAQGELFGQLAGVLQGIDCVPAPTTGPEAQLCADWLGTLNNWKMGTEPNYVYGAPNRHFYTYGVHPTRGVYQAIRRPCNEIPGSTVSASCEVGGKTLVEEFDIACEAADDNSPVSYPPYTQPAPNSPERHMLTCDPKCHPKATQITEGVQRIYSENPFIIVE